MALIDNETKKTVAGFDEWTEGVRQLTSCRRTEKGRSDCEAPAIEDLYPDFVETGSVYEFVAEACTGKDDKARAIAQLGRYSKIGGRDPDTVKKHGQLLEEAGKRKKRPPR